MDRRVTSPVWGTPPPCKQALSRAMFFFSTGTRIALRRPKMPRTRNKQKIETRNSSLFLQLFLSSDQIPIQISLGDEV